MVLTATAGVVLQQGGGGAATGAASLVFVLVYLAIIVATIAGTWKAFAKAGEPGWAAIVPIYNVYVMIKIGGNPWWYLLLMLVPLVNIIIAFKVSIDVAGAFGQGIGFGLGLAILSFVFWPILGFGDYSYQGATA